MSKSKRDQEDAEEPENRIKLTRMQKEASTLISAACSAIWVTTQEQSDYIREMTGLASAYSWDLCVWDSDYGIRVLTKNGLKTIVEAKNDPKFEALKVVDGPYEAAKIPQLWFDKQAADDKSQGVHICILQNITRLMSPQVVQAMYNSVILGKARQTYLIVLTCDAEIPAELEKEFVNLDYPLPTRKELHALAKGVVEEEDELGGKEQVELTLDSAMGMTRSEAETAFSLSMTVHDELNPHEVWAMKAQAVEKGGLLTVYRGKEKFDTIGGLQKLKDFCKRSLADATARSEIRPKGVLLLGVSGTGKSAIAKALGNETGRPTVTLDIGSLMGGIIGQTESQTRAALKTIDAMAPCILFCDEIEKSLAGAGGSGNNDSGVTKRLFGSLLTWMNDHESDVYLVASANSVENLPIEFTRAERFDGMFFIDIPNKRERKIIWDMYRNLYKIDPKDPAPDNDENWTGAEIRACCRLSALLGYTLQQAAANIAPIFKTARKSVDDLRQWASGRCLSASDDGLYTYTSSADSPSSSVEGGRKLLDRKKNRGGTLRPEEN